MEVLRSSGAVIGAVTGCWLLQLTGAGVWGEEDPQAQCSKEESSPALCGQYFGAAVGSEGRVRSLHWSRPSG